MFLKKMIGDCKRGNNDDDNAGRVHRTPVGVGMAVWLEAAKIKPNTEAERYLALLPDKQEDNTSTVDACAFFI